MINKIVYNSYYIININRYLLYECYFTMYACNSRTSRTIKYVKYQHFLFIISNKIQYKKMKIQIK